MRKPIYSADSNNISYSEMTVMKSGSRNVYRNNVILAGNDISVMAVKGSVNTVYCGECNPILCSIQ